MIGDGMVEGFGCNAGARFAFVCMLKKTQSLRLGVIELQVTCDV